MLNAGVVPVNNENDSVAVDEIRYGDNDSLAAQVALAIGAAGVVLWTVFPGCTPLILESMPLTD
jgi:glutamate 5-kinase